MDYKIVITKLENNENYEKELKEWEEYQERRRYYSGEPSNPRPNPQITKTMLQTYLTKEEFEAVRKACIEKM